MLILKFRHILWIFAAGAATGASGTKVDWLHVSQQIVQIVQHAMQTNV